ncbi:MAG: DUF4342 domain-containing protein [Clostridium sp.]|nr:DUF4342 domain-containing protein [Clostridium sp.]
MNENEIKKNEIIEVKDYKEEGNEDNRKTNKRHGGIGKVIAKLVKLIGKVIRKGNNIYLEIKKENEETITISLTIMALLLIFLSVPTIILLVIGLFCGYEYSLSGSIKNSDKANQAFKKVSEAAVNIKEDFKNGYNE